MKELTLGQILVGMEQGKYKEGTTFESGNGHKVRVINKGKGKSKDTVGLTLVNDTFFGDSVAISVDEEVWFKTDADGKRIKKENKIEIATVDELIDLLNNHDVGDFKIQLSESGADGSVWGFGVTNYALKGIADIGYSNKVVIIDIEKEGN